MNRNLKAMGLLVAALALSAVLAAEASAQHKWITTAGQKAHLTVESEGAQAIRPNTENPNPSFTCNKFKATGSFTDGATEITVTPSLFECSFVLNEEKILAYTEFNGCDYRFHSTTTSGNPTGGEHANFEILCPAGKEIEIKVTAFKFKCLNIPAQEVTDAVRYDYEETANKATDVTVKVTPHNIKTKTLNSMYCPTEGGKTIEHTKGLYTGNLRFAGFKDEAHKEPTSISAGGELLPAHHNFRTPEASEAHLTAEAEGAQTFTGITGNSEKHFSCNKVNFSGEVANGAEDATATPTYSECKAVEENEKGKTEVMAFFEFNGCDYLFGGQTTNGNPTGGEHSNVQIECPEGKEIEIKVTVLKLKCVNIPPQLVTDAVRYKNVTTEAGKVTDITIELTAHSIKNTTLNNAACQTGTGKPVEHTNGLFTGNVTMRGFKDEAHTKATSVSV